MTTYLVGRSVATADIVTPAENPAVSRTHLRLTQVTGSRYRIDDLNSTGGTYVLQGVAWERVTKAEVGIDDPIRLTDYETTVRRLLASKEQKTLLLDMPLNQAAPMAGPNAAPLQQPLAYPVPPPAPAMDQPPRSSNKPQSHDVFLSYSRHDKDRVLPLVKLLEYQGWRVFWDIKIAPGQQWLDVIEGAITGSKAVIVVWSENAVKSEWVKAEAIRARELGHLVPIRIDQCRLPMPFGMVQTPDITIAPGMSVADPTVKNLIDAVGGLIQRPASQAFQASAFVGGPPLPQASAAGVATQFDWLHIFFSLNGRINRKEFWFGTLASIPPCIVLSLLITAAVRAASPELPVQSQYAGAGMTYFLVMSYVNVALLKKRIHDFGRSGWWAAPVMVILMIAYVASSVVQGPHMPQEAVGAGIWSLILLACWLIIGFHRGDVGSNKYGPPRLKR